MLTVFPVRFAWYVLAAAAAGLLLYLVAPILTPFLLSAVLAYICLPPVDWIARKLPRWLAAAIVMALLVIGLAALALIVLPMVERQFVAFLQRMPEYLDWARSRLGRRWRFATERIPYFSVCRILRSCTVSH